MKKYILFLLFLCVKSLFAQNLSDAHRIIDTLTSKTMWGRGYTNMGMAKAADFIVNKFKDYGLAPIDGKEFKQNFSFAVNTFPGKMDVYINGKKLIPGKDFIMLPASIGARAKGKLTQTDSVTFIQPENRLMVIVKDKLTWSVAQEKSDFTGIELSKTAVTEDPDSIEMDIENSFVPDFKASNVCAIIKGTAKPDSVLVITAHYDHLGGMGDQTYFPGANDNASGVSFLLGLAKYYAVHPQSYSMAFICFAAEEAGLVGSKYFTENPLIPLEKIKFLINVDMVGTGEDGITVVNATHHTKEFAILNQINDSAKYLVKINPRGKAANSDHYFFTEKGVPAFFIYTQGGVAAYHDVNDIAATLPLTEYDDLFKLFVDFNKALMK